MRPRVIATLLIDGKRAVKTRAFSSPRYLGDPINIVKILNDKCVDELVVIDIGARGRGGADFALVDEIASEAFMPVAYGGGISKPGDAEALLTCGVEKLLLGSAIRDSPDVVSRICIDFGAQAVCAVVDYRERRFRSQREVVAGGRSLRGIGPVAWARRAEELGVGEILLTNMGREGLRSGYDLRVIADVSRAVGVPVVANGGAGVRHDFQAAVRVGASAVAAGSMFCFYGRFDAVLINYPSETELNETFNSQEMCGDEADGV